MEKITAKQIQNISSVMGVRCIFFEPMLFSVADKLSEDYQGGSWKVFELSNGGAYMAPDEDESFQCSWAENYFSDELSADAFGVVCSLFSLNWLNWQHPHNNEWGRWFEKLRAFAGEHEEALKIFRAID